MAEEYIQRKKELQKNLLAYLTVSEDAEENYQNFIKVINDQKIYEKKYEFIEFLHLFSNICNNHNQSPTFWTKVEKIFGEIKNSLETFSINNTIFNIFSKNKKILLYLINQKIIKIDVHLFELLKSEIFEKAKYQQYFYPEIKPFYDEIQEKKNNDIMNGDSRILMYQRIINEQKEIEEVDYGEIYNQDKEVFYQKRLIGENDDILCKLIRDDNIDDFISHVCKNDFDLKSEVADSIYETNPFLVDKSPTLIEYTAFFGSIQIFKYLLNKIGEVSPSIWLYAVHGDHPEIIQILDEKKIEINSILDVYIEAIKCHHNELANYIENEILSKDDDEKKVKKLDKEKSRSYILKYFNYQFFDFDLKDTKSLIDLTMFDYPSLFEILAKNTKIDACSFISSKHKSVEIIKNDYYFTFTEEKNTLLHIAAENGSIGVTEILVSIDEIDLNVKNYRKKWTHKDYDDLSEEEVEEIFKNKGEDWWKDETCTDNEDKTETLIESTPLGLAITNSNLDIVQLLLSKPRIDPNANSIYRSWKWTSTEGRRYGKEITDEKESTPLFDAVENNYIEIVQLLLSNPKIDVNSFTKLRKSNISTDKWVYKDWSIYEYSKTALHTACEKEYFEIFLLLISCKNIDVNEKLKQISTSLNYESDHDNDYYQIHNWELDERLKFVEEDYKNNSRSKYNIYELNVYKKEDEKTALDIATRKKNSKIIEILKKNNTIEVNHISDEQIAIENRNNFLIEHMQDGCNIY